MKYSSVKYTMSRMLLLMPKGVITKVLVEVALFRQPRGVHKSPCSCQLGSFLQLDAAYAWECFCLLCAQLVNVFARLVIFCNCLRLLSHCAVFLIYIWVAVWIWFYDLLLMLPGCVRLIVLVFMRWLSPTMMGYT